MTAAPDHLKGCNIESYINSSVAMSESHSRKMKHIKVPRHAQKYSNPTHGMGQLNPFREQHNLSRDLSAQPLPNLSENQFRADDQSSFIINDVTTDHGDNMDERSFIQLNQYRNRKAKQSLQSGKTSKSSKSHLSLYKRLMKTGGALGGDQLSQTYNNIQVTAQNNANSGLLARLIELKAQQAKKQQDKDQMRVVKQSRELLHIPVSQFNDTQNLSDYKLDKVERTIYYHNRSQYLANAEEPSFRRDLNGKSKKDQYRAYGRSSYHTQRKTLPPRGGSRLNEASSSNAASKALLHSEYTYQPDNSRSRDTSLAKDRPALKSALVTSTLDSRNTLGLPNRLQKPLTLVS